MKIVITVTAEVDDMEGAALVRDEIAGGLQDAKDSGELPQLDFSVDDPEAIETDRHESLIDLARERHVYRDDANVRVDDDARLSDTGEGCWVQGWLWVDPDAMVSAGLYDTEDEAAEAVESEGGTCD